MAKRCNVIIPIDTNFFDEKIISRLGHMYENTAKIHLAVMGPRFELVKKCIAPYSPHITTIYEITAPGFNYAYAVNKMLREYLTNGVIGEEEVVVLNDLWSTFSLLQLDDIIKKLNWEKYCIEIPIWRDSLAVDPVRKESQRLMLSVTKRAARCKTEKKHRSKTLVPVQMIQAGILMNQMHGLEERLFTDKSRLFLSQQIDKFGLMKKPIDQLGLRMSIEEVYNQNSMAIDEEVWPEVVSTHDAHPGFIPSNIGVEFGSPDRILQLVLENNKIFWRGTRRDTIVIPKDNIDDLQTEQVESRKDYKSRNTVIIEPDDPLKRIIKDPSMNGDVLLMVNNLLEDVISTTPLIKALFQKYANIDILTNRKCFPHIKLLQNHMVRNVFEVGDLQKPLLDFNNYKRIIKTSGCCIELAADCDFIECEELDNKVQSNLNPNDMNLSQHFPPHCVYKTKPIKIPTNVVVLMSSMHNKAYRKKRKEYIGFFGGLLKHLLDSNINVMTLHMEGETNHIQYGGYRKHTKNFTCAERVSLNDSILILKYASLVIMSPYTDAFWLTYGLKQKSLVVMEDDSKILLPTSRYNFADYRHDIAKEGITQWVVENY